MDELELEDWYAQEREKLEEVVMKALQDNKHPDAAEVTFNKKYRALIKTYQEKQQTLFNKEQRSKKIAKPIARIREQITLIQQTPGFWFQRKKKEYQKWRFDRKVKRILKEL